jgi:hypothetical protein
MLQIIRQNGMRSTITLVQTIPSRGDTVPHKLQDRERDSPQTTSPRQRTSCIGNVADMVITSGWSPSCTRMTRYIPNYTFRLADPTQKLTPASFSLTLAKWCLYFCFITDCCRQCTINTRANKWNPWSHTFKWPLLPKISINFRRKRRATFSTWGRLVGLRWTCHSRQLGCRLWLCRQPSCQLWRGRHMEHRLWCGRHMERRLWRGRRPSHQRRVAGNWIAIYVGDFGKYAHVLYAFANKHTCIVYFS